MNLVLVQLNMNIERKNTSKMIGTTTTWKGMETDLVHQ
jgi:hypothetical protein